MEDKSLQLLTEQELEIHRRFTNGTRDIILCNEIRFYKQDALDTYYRENDYFHESGLVRISIVVAQKSDIFSSQDSVATRHSSNEFASALAAPESRSYKWVA